MKKREVGEMEEILIKEGKKEEKSRLVKSLGLYKDLKFILGSIPNLTGKLEVAIGSIKKRIIQDDFDELAEDDLNIKQLREGIISTIGDSISRREFLITAKMNLLDDEIKKIEKRLQEMGVPGIIHKPIILT
jgi:hypothetical protein